MSRGLLFVNNALCKQIRIVLTEVAGRVAYTLSGVGTVTMVTLGSVSMT